MAKVMATATSSRPIIAVPITSKIPLWVISVSPTPNSANSSPSSAAKSSSSTTGSSGALAALMNRDHDCRPLVLDDSLIAVRKEKDSATMATPSTSSGTHHQELSSRLSGCPERMLSYLWNAS